MENLLQFNRGRKYLMGHLLPQERVAHSLQNFTVLLKSFSAVLVFVWGDMQQ